MQGEPIIEKITGQECEKYFSDCAKLADRALENKKGFRSLRRPKLNFVKEFHAKPNFHF